VKLVLAVKTHDDLKGWITLPACEVMTLESHQAIGIGFAA